MPEDRPGPWNVFIAEATLWETGRYKMQFTKLDGTILGSGEVEIAGGMSALSPPSQEVIFWSSGIVAKVADPGSTGALHRAPLKE